MTWPASVAELGSLNDKDTLFRAIGSVVVSFQRTERELTDALGVLLGLKSDEERRILSAAMSFGQKVDLFAALHRRDANAKKADLCHAACNYLRAAEEFRNDIVHSDYFVVSGKKMLRWAQQKI